MKVISIIAEKGGSGKSTLAWNLAISLDNMKKYRVLLLDADAKQQSLWRVADVFRDADTPTVNQANSGNIDDKIAEAEELGFTHIIIDTPPHVGSVVEKAIQVSDLVLAPLRVSALDALSFSDTYEVIMKNKRADAKAFSVLTFASRSKATVAEFQEFLISSCPELPEVPVVIFERTAHRDAMQAGLGITETRDLRSLKARSEIQKLTKFIEKETK